VSLVDAKETAELLKQILTNHRGQTIFVSGHNNTVPELATALGGEKLPLIPESEFDNMFIVTVYRFGRAKVVKLKYGNPNTAGIGTGTMVP
jgi:hypothetical protein